MIAVCTLIFLAFFGGVNIRVVRKLQFPNNSFTFIGSSSVAETMVSKGRPSLIMFCAMASALFCSPLALPQYLSVYLSKRQVIKLVA